MTVFWGVAFWGAPTPSVLTSGFQAVSPPHTHIYCGFEAAAFKGPCRAGQKGMRAEQVKIPLSSLFLPHFSYFPSINTPQIFVSFLLISRVWGKLILTIFQCFCCFYGGGKFWRRWLNHSESESPFADIQMQTWGRRCNYMLIRHLQKAKLMF